MLARTARSAGYLKASSRLSGLSSAFRATCHSSTMSSNITLYTWPTPNGIKASITLEELDLPYKTEGIDIGTNVQKEEYVTKKNQWTVIHFRARATTSSAD